MFFWEKQKVITALYLRYTKPICEQNGLTQMEYDILMYLSENPDCNTAAEMIRVRKYTKSHVSSALKLLRLKGFVRHGEGDHRRRNVRIRLTEKANGIIQAGQEAQRRFAAALFRGFSEDERENCIRFFERLSENAFAAEAGGAEWTCS